MFTQKLQNPFLKPTPYFSTNNCNNNSYAPPLPPTSKYSAYSAYDAEKINRYDSYASSNERALEVNPPSKYNPSLDIADILRNNPFNRPSNTIFNTSSANSYSPAKYDSGRNSKNNLSSSYQKRDTNDIYSTTRRNNAINQGVTNQYSQNHYNQGRHTPKKYDNYLSTSSADSAVTYINKIYEIDEDKPEGFGGMNNPFQRKNLVEAKVYEKQSKPANSYDHATMKYISDKRQYSAPNYLENNYFPTRQQEPKSNEYAPYSKDYSHLQYKKQSYDSKKDLNQQNSYRAYEEPEPYTRNSKEKVTFGKGQMNLGSKNNIESKYDVNYEEKYPDDRYESKYNKYEEIGKQNYGSKRGLQHRPYNQEKQFYNNKYDERFKDLQKSDSKFDFQQSEHKQKDKKYTKAQIKDDSIFKNNYELSKLDKYSQNQDIYKYSSKEQANDYRDVKRQSKKSQERVNFADPETSNETSKHRNREYTGVFQTLGGVPSSKYRQDLYYKPNEAPSKKLISSQVEEYQAHHESKTQPTKYEKPKENMQNSKEKVKFTHYEQEQDEQYGYNYENKKGAVRDTNQNYPSIIHYNGMVFSRIEVK